MVGEPESGHGQAGQFADVLPADVLSVLTAEQAARTVARLRPMPSVHGVAYRASVRLFGRRVYFAVLSGRESRSPGRVAVDGHGMTAAGLAVRIALVCGWVTAVLATLAACGVLTIYLAKSYVGIDLMDGPSFLHHWFF